MNNNNNNIYIIIDLIVLLLLLGIAYQIDIAFIPILHNQPIDANILFSFWWFTLLYIIFFIQNGIYTKRTPFDNQLKIIISSIISATLFGIVLLFFAQSWDVARLMILIFVFLTLIVFPFIRYLYFLVLSKLKFFQKNLLIVGAGEAASLLIKQITKNPTMGYKIIGILDDNPDKHPTTLHGYKILGPISQIRHLDLKNTDIIIAIPTLNRHQMLTLLYICQKKADNVKIMPDLTGIPVNSISVEEFFDGQTVLLNIKNNLKSKFNLLIKRIFDFIVGTILLPFILLILAILSVAIIIESPGNPVFTGIRLGKNGRVFKCYKFRSMFVNSDNLLEEYLNRNPDAKAEWNTYKKLKGFDPRVTKVGKFMRKTSLDELPQIFNVIIGNMSLVGPRPYLERERIEMEKSYDVITEVTPGITGLWQINGRSELPFQQRLELDEYYVRNWSVWLDIMILIKTIKVVLFHKGAY